MSFRISDLVANGIVEGSTIKKTGGTGSQFLKADGTVDSSAYITGITSGMVTTALGYTPVQPNGTGASGTWGISITGTAAGETLATVTGRGAITNSFVSLLGGSRIVVQNSTDGGNNRGIFMWNTSDTNWGIYMSTAGASKSLSSGTASSSIDGQTSHHIRFRAGGGSDNGFIWENPSEQTLMSLKGNNGNLYTRGQIYAGNSTSNLVLHTGNYNSYALPLSGGTMTGAILSTASNQNFTNFTARNTSTAASMQDHLYYYIEARYNSGANGTNVYHWVRSSWEYNITNNYSDITMGAYNNGTSYGVLFRVSTDGQVYATNSFRAPIFYDSANTTYYLDPNNTNTALKIAGNIDMGDGRGDSSIIMGDNDQGARIIHNNSDRIGFLTQGGNWGAYLDDSNNFYAEGSMRAPIFYDSADTFYYVDPASTSRIGGIDMYSTLSLRQGSQINLYTSANNLRGYIQATDVDDNHFTIATSGGEDIVFRDGGISGTRNLVIRGGNAGTEAYGSMRAPIFYDSDNTGYYGNFAGTSNLYALTVNQTISGNINGSAASLSYYGATGYQWTGSQILYYWTKIANISNLGDVQFTLEISAKTDVNYVPYVLALASIAAWNNSTQSIKLDALSSLDREIRIAVDNNGDVWLYAQVEWSSYLRWRVKDTLGSPTIYTSGFTQVTTQPANSTYIICGQNMRGTQGAMSSASVNNSENRVGVLSALGPVYGTAFYDRDNTAYYLDPNGLSNVLRIQTKQNWYDNSATDWGGGINLQGSAASIGWQPSDSSWWYMLHTSANDLNFYRRNTSGNWNQDGIWHEDGRLEWRNNYLQVNTSVRSPIFYDSDNTSYYGDFAGTSNLNALTTNGLTILGGQIYVSSTNSNTLNSGYGVNGSADIWINYRGYNDGFTQWRNFNIGDGKGNNILWADAANKRVSINNGQSASHTLHVAGTGFASSDFRAPIFYDSANTGYYVDPNSTSVLYYLQLNASESMNLYGIRGRFSNEYMHLYNKVGVGHPGGWGQGETSTPSQGLSTYGGINISYGTNASSTFNGSLYVNHRYGSSILEDSNGLMINGNYTNGQYSHRFRKWDDGGGVPLYLQFTSGTANSWSNLARFGPWSSDSSYLRVFGSGRFDSDVRATIFYDVDDTNYYANFADTGRSIYTAGYMQSDRLIMKGSSGGGQIYPTISYGGVSVYGGDSLTNGAWFTVTGLSYGSSPGAGSAEFVIRTALTSKFAMFSYDGSTYTGRYSLWGSSGNVTIGSATTDYGYKLYVLGDIYATGNVIAYSDKSIKTNIRDIENPLDRVLKSRGVVYDRTDIESNNNIGFIAQELEEQFPELVSTGNDGRKGVLYPNMVAVLLEAIKEQQKQIDKLKTLIDGTSK